MADSSADSSHWARVRSFWPIATLPILALLLQAVTLLPAASSAAIYRPEILDAPFGVLYTLEAAFAAALLVAAAVGVVRCLFPRVAGSVIAFSALLLAHVGLTSAMAFYVLFGRYPRALAMATDFAAAPESFIAYGVVGVSPSGGHTLGVAVGLTIIGAAITTYVAWHGSPSLTRSLATGVTGIALLWLVHTIPPHATDRQHAFRLAEQSLPSVKYLFDVSRTFDSSRVEEAASVIPTSSVLPPSPRTETPRHVLLIIAECLRADHLPAYGYSRDTTPLLQADSGHWLVFSRAYAHGSRTTDSFPVIFNGRYLAAVDHRNDGASATWRSLRDAGVATAFMSASATEWGGITHALALDELDRHFIASMATPSERRTVSAMSFDYGVDDLVPLHKYFDFLHDQRDRRSFSVLHLDGSHFPFKYDDTPDRFLPSLRHPADEQAGGAPAVIAFQTRDSATTESSEAVRELTNAYDNSIRHVDAIVRQAVQWLEDDGLADDSVVIVTSDHGESLGEHGTLFHGTTLYEEQVHVPLLVRVGADLPGLRARLEATSARVVGQVDLMPTLLEVFGARTPPDVYDGRSWLSSGEKPYELLLFRGIGEQVALVSSDRKYLYDLVGHRAEEYLIAADPAEQHDLWTGSEASLDAFLDGVKLRLMPGGPE